MPQVPREATPSASLIPPAPELRFRLSVALREVDLLRRILRVAEAVEADARPAAVKLFSPVSGPNRAETAVPRD